MAINFIAQQAGRIVAHANRFLVSELRRRGVTDIVPSHGDILNYLLRHDGATSTDIAVGISRLGLTERSRPSRCSSIS